MMDFLFTRTPLRFLIESIWRDEAFSVLLAKKNIIEIVTTTVKDSNPPLYYIILHYWMFVFGTSEIYIRLLSFVFFWATMYVYYLFIKNVLKINKFWSLVYLLLFLLNPVLNYFAFEARMYTMFAFLASLSFYFLLMRKYLPYSISLVLGFYTHYFMILVAITQILVVCFIERAAEMKKFFKYFTRSALLFFPWLVYFLFQKPSFNINWILKPPTKTIFNLPSIIYTGFEPQESISANFSQIQTVLSLVFITVIITFLIHALRRNSLEKRIPATLLYWSFLPPLVTLAVSFFRPVFLPRYLIFSTVGVLLFLSFFAEKIEIHKKIFFITLLMTLTLNYNKLQIEFRQKTDFRKVANEIKGLMKNNDIVYVTSELELQPFQYYLGEKRVFVYNKSYAEVPWYIGRAVMTENMFINKLPFYPKKAFVLRENLSYEVQSRL